jgi:hypothetical protein
MAYWQNGLVTEEWAGMAEMAEWHNGGTAKWQNGFPMVQNGMAEMAEWRNGGTGKW